MIDKLLRIPLAPQLKAVLEKLDNVNETSSLTTVENFFRVHAKGMTRYECFVLRRAIRKANRLYMLNDAMEVVLGTGVYQPISVKTQGAKPMTMADITRESLRVLEKNMHATPVKRENARVDY